MGLDGISINQLRVTQENNSAELNNQARFNINNDSRAIDGLSQGHRINPDQERDREKNQLAKQSEEEENDNENSQDEDDTVEAVQTIKYDLSKSDKYSLKIDDETNSIYIVDKTTKEVVQSISAEQLSHLVGFLSNPQGSVISKRY